MKRILKRWRWILALGALIGITLGTWAVWWEPADLQVTRECLAIPWKLKNPLRVAILTDIHTGAPFNGLSKLRAVVKRTNAEQPDVTFILGDLVVHGVVGGSFVSPEDISAELKGLRAPGGVFAVLGNHDVWLDAPRVRRSLENAAIEVVEDRAVKVAIGTESIWIAGVTDYWTQPHDVKAALSAVNDDSPVLVVTHNPDIFPDVPPRVTLTLAGHTHGGQVRLPIFGAPIVPSNYGQRFAAGHVVEDQRHLYIATGIGTSILPVRFRVPPTIPILTLTSDCRSGLH